MAKTKTPRGLQTVPKAVGQDLRRDLKVERLNRLTAIFSKDLKNDADIIHHMGKNQIKIPPPLAQIRPDVKHLLVALGMMDFRIGGMHTAEDRYLYEQVDQKGDRMESPNIILWVDKLGDYAYISMTSGFGFRSGTLSQVLHGILDVLQNRNKLDAAR